MVRQALGLLNGSAETALGEARSVQELRVDGYGGLWTRDYQAQPAQTSDPITPSGSDLTLTFRALRIDIPAGGSGTITVDLVKADGSRDAARVLNVGAGEVLSYSSACCRKISAASAGVTVFALG